MLGAILQLLPHSSAFSKEVGDADMRIIQSSPSGLTIEFRPSFVSPDSAKIGDAVYRLPRFLNAIHQVQQTPGSPEFLVRQWPVRFQGPAGNRVEIVTSEFTDVPDYALLPVPRMHRDSLGPAREFLPDRKSYVSTGFLPAAIAALGPVGEARGTFLGGLRITPYQYDPASRTLRRYTRIVVRVTFGPAARVAARPDAMTAGIAVNDDQFQAQPAPVTQRRTAALTNSVLANGVWFKFALTDEGMYKISGQDLLNAGVPAAVDPSTVRIFNNGGDEPPMDPTLPYPDDLLEVGTTVVDGGTAGRIDAGDYVVFYGRGARGWKYDGQTFRHTINHYAESNVYWLTYGGSQHKPMGVLSNVNNPAALPVTSLDCKAMREDDRINLIGSGLEWLGPAMNTGDQMVYVTELTGLDHARPIRYRFHLGANSSTSSSFTLFEHGTQLGPQVNVAGTIVGEDFYSQFIDAFPEVSALPTFADNQSQIRMSFGTFSVGGTGYLDWFELFYGRRPAAIGDLLAFSVPDSSATFSYALSGYSTGQVAVYDVTSFSNVSVMSDAARSADSCLFQIAGTPGSPRSLFVVGQAGYKRVTSLQNAANQNLHGDASEADNIIIVSPDLRSAADRLRAYRQQSAPRPITTKVVDVTQIYNEFGGGTLSPTAIRNYLRYVSTNWSAPPKYVLLFGTGSYDYRGILGGTAEGIPPWETEESFVPISSFATDDGFAVFTATGQVGMGVGRLTAHSIDEANTMVDKIIEYETHPAQDPWKIRVTLVADDALAGVLANGTVENDGTTHLDHAENVAKRVLPLFEQRKIYLFNYPTEYTTAGRRKPAVNQAIVDQINEGTILLNYSGHGNPDLWAHEHVFVRETDFQKLVNKGKYFFLLAATCNFSAFDAVGQESGGEILVAKPNAGAIATFSATRAVIPFYNEALNDELFRQLFRADANGRVLPERLGEVVFRAKQNFTGENDQKFFLLGDPALTIDFPPMFAQVDSINSLPGTQTAQLRALGKASVRATVRDSLLQPLSSFSGTAQVVVYDADQTVHINDPDAGPITYQVSGSTLFRGAESVSAGTTAASFVVPKDISYSNNNGRVTVYVWNLAADGAGYSTNFLVGGTDSTAPVDTKGPDVRLFVDSRSFRPGDVVGASPVLLADLSDSSGINTSTAGVGHRLELWVDDAQQSIDVGAYYQTKPNTYVDGTLQYPLGTMSNGSHKLRFRAWDTYNNPSTTETIFNVVTGSGLQLDNVFNFPNPIRATTSFTFQHNQVVPIDAEVKIYTAAGRMIQSLKKENIVTQFVQIPWDGRDRDGDRLANGVYLYKILASTQDHRFSTEATGKITIER